MLLVLVAGLTSGCATITWDAGTERVRVVCRDTKSIVEVPGGRTVTITHPKGAGICDAVERPQ